ncbi:MAG: hypothetical protein WCC32_17790 [Terriglobales bacterium]
MDCHSEPERSEWMNDLSLRYFVEALFVGVLQQPASGNGEWLELPAAYEGETVLVILDEWPRASS